MARDSPAFGQSCPRGVHRHTPGLHPPADWPTVRLIPRSIPMSWKKPPKSILAVDIGGSNVKVLATGQTERRRAPSGSGFTPQKMVEVVTKLAAGWEYEAISIGSPGPVGAHGPRSEPGNLGPGWVGFNFAAAFDKPVRMLNDAAM